MLSIQRILVPVDFSGSALKALDQAVEMAKSFDASLDLLHVFEEPSFPSFYGAGALAIYGHVPDLREGAQQELEKLGNRVKADFSNVQTHFVEGHAVDQILSFAQSNQHDLIVIATHGLTGLRHVLLGSVTERVVREAPCGVYVVRG